jgi:hypothetical protein
LTRTRRSHRVRTRCLGPLYFLWIRFLWIGRHHSRFLRHSKSTLIISILFCSEPSCARNGSDVYRISIATFLFGLWEREIDFTYMAFRSGVNGHIEHAILRESGGVRHAAAISVTVSERLLDSNVVPTDISALRFDISP